MVNKLQGHSVAFSPALSILSKCSPPAGHLTDYTQIILMESNNFKELADAVSASSALSLEAVQVEMTMVDMRVMIQSSNLEATKVPQVLECILETKNTTRGLQKLTSKISGVVDSVTVVQAYALGKLEGTYIHKLLPLWFMSIIRCDPFQNSVATDIFKQTLDYFLRHLERLISEIEISSDKLLMLKACLTSIQELIFQENFTVLSARSSLLQEVWTKLGGNKKELQKYDRDLALLKDLAFGHRQISDHLAAALTILREARQGMEEIRGRCKKHLLSLSGSVRV